jgi:serine O-acetyltransferase
MTANNLRTELNTSDQVSAIEPDWSRERIVLGWDTGRYLLRSIRRYQRHASHRGPTAWAGRKWAVLVHRFWSVVSGAEIPINTVIGGGLILPHPNGVVINHQAVIEPNCLLFHQVTLGVGGLRQGAPIVGGHVDIGAGAKILGGVRLGDHCRIGANAVVLDDVPPGATAVGVPARIIPPPGNGEQRRSGLV